MLGTFKKVFPYILVGVGIGALIQDVYKRQAWGICQQVLYYTLSLCLYQQHGFVNHLTCGLTGDRCAPILHHRKRG